MTHTRLTILLLASISALVASTASCVEPLDPDTGMSISDPALDLYRIAEAQRQDRMARQLDLNNRMAWMAGYGPRYPNPFEPWPRVPGDIWGYPLPQPIRQPIGQETIQTGPNRWYSRPVYSAPVALVQSRPIATPARFTPPGPSDADPQTRVAPDVSAPQRKSGPRAF